MHVSGTWKDFTQLVGSSRAAREEGRDEAEANRRYAVFQAGCWVLGTRHSIKFRTTGQWGGGPILQMGNRGSESLNGGNTAKK